MNELQSTFPIIFAFFSSTAGASVTILTRRHTGPYDLKNFVQNNVFAFL